MGFIRCDVRSRGPRAATFMRSRGVDAAIQHALHGCHSLLHRLHDLHRLWLGALSEGDGESINFSAGRRFAATGFGPKGDALTHRDGRRSQRCAC